jgi:hypothetical protein
MYKFKAFRAIDEPETCRWFIQGHRKVLMDYGITNITTNTDEWLYNPNIYGIVAVSDDDSDIYGGIRIHISEPSDLLPVETAVGYMDNKVHTMVEDLRINGGVGELCALWNAKAVAGLGISVLLTRAGISIVNQLNFQTVLGICGSYTLDMFQNAGFVVNKSVGNKGEFFYPKEDYIAWVLGILNAHTLETASPYDKERMMSLRNNPVQQTTETSQKGMLEVSYNLIIP